MVRFRHLHPLAAHSRANVGIKRTTSNFMILVELFNLHLSANSWLAALKCQIRSTSLSDDTEATRMKAVEAIRSLIGEIVLQPEGETLAVEVRGGPGRHPVGSRWTQDSARISEAWKEE